MYLHIFNLDDEFNVEMAIKKRVKIFRVFHLTKVLTKPSLKGSTSLSNILHAIINSSSSYATQWLILRCLNGTNFYSIRKFPLFIGIALVAIT